MFPTILAIDYSTTCTGLALFKDKKLIKSTFIKNTTKFNKLPSNIKQVKRLEFMANSIIEFIDTNEVDQVIIEEVNHGRQRLSQKTLNGGHFIFYFKMLQKHPTLLENMLLIDSDGRTGWRTVLDIRLTDDDRKYNKTCTKKNKKRKITKKDVAQRWVNAKWGTDFDVIANKKDEDVVDAIGLGSAYLKLIEE